MAFDFGNANEAQKEAIQTTEGPLLIIAGPGTGKTFTLVKRIVYLITQKDVKPEEIMVATFTEKAAKDAGYDVEVIKIPMEFSGRYVAEGGKGGICKLIIDKKYKRLIGCHVIGNYASEFIVAASIMVETQMRLDEIKELVFPHPTVCEIIREAIFQSKL